MNKDYFTRKTYGRIFVSSAQHVEEVRQIITQLDSFEAEYLPDNLVAVFDPRKEAVNGMVYLHKFEIDKIALSRALFEAGILHILVDGQQELSYL